MVQHPVGDRCMVIGCVRSFNQPIEHLDTSSLQQADSIFAFARKFNQPVGSCLDLRIRRMHILFFKAMVSVPCACLGFFYLLTSQDLVGPSTPLF